MDIEGKYVEVVPSIELEVFLTVCDNKGIRWAFSSSKSEPARHYVNIDLEDLNVYYGVSNGKLCMLRSDGLYPDFIKFEIGD
jgi:hypothetical protein